MRMFYGILTLCCICSIAPRVHAVVTEYENRLAWQNAAGPHTLITFQGFSEPVIITNQYASLGVLFSDGNDWIHYNNSFPNDGVGLTSSDIVIGMIHLSFAQPMTAIGADFAGIIDFQVFANGQMIYSSSPFFTISSHFGGLISSVPFDAAVIRNPAGGSVNIDDLYFGPPVPAPAALPLLALAAFTPLRRRCT